MTVSRFGTIASVGLVSLALLAAGEWTRRKESMSATEALPIANIPAILTAAAKPGASR